MKLSIIVPNYNKAPYLRDCLDTIFNQSYTDCEVIVVDDCSTDGSLDVLKGYGERYGDRFSVITNDRNRGVAVSRELGIERAAGIYITTLDADDYYATGEKLLNEMALIEEYERNKEEPPMVYSGTVLVRESDGVTLSRPAIVGVSSNDHFTDILTRGREIPLDFIYKKEYHLAVGGYDPNIRLFEDWDLKLRLSKKYRFLYSGYPGTVYRIHSTGLSSSSAPVLLKELLKVFFKNVPKKDPLSLLWYGFRLAANLLRNKRKLKAAFRSAARHSGST